MNCQTLQHKVLALPDPRQLPEPLREHLAGCAGCAAWWKQAAHLEHLLERLPAPPPPADKKTALIDELTEAGPVITSIPKAQASKPFISRRVLTSAGGLAAAVLVGVGIWMIAKLGPKPETAQTPAPRHPLLDKVMQRNLALMKANPGEHHIENRLDTLGGLAEDLAGETRGLARAATPDELNELAGLYKLVVNDGIVKQAQSVQPNNLSPDQKKALFTRHATKLAETGAEAEKMMNEVPPESKPALKRIADTARDGQHKLDTLAREG